MSTSPYSIDLREKVIKYIESGNSQQSASKIFRLNVSTVNRWWLRYKREGNYAAKKRPGGKHPQKSLYTLMKGALNYTQLS
jgi:transposase